MTGGATHTALNAPAVRLVPPPAPPPEPETAPAAVSAPPRPDLDAQRSVLQDRQAAIRREHARATLAGRPLPSRDELAQIEHALEALADAETLQHEDTRAAQEAAAADRRARTGRTGCPPRIAERLGCDGQRRERRLLRA